MIRAPINYPKAFNFAIMAITIILQQFKIITNMTIIIRLLAVLNLPNKVPDLISYARRIHAAMYKNSHFPNSVDKLSQLQEDVNLLEKLQLALDATPPQTSCALCNLVLKAVKADLRSLQRDVQEAADNDMENAEVIIISSGMSLKKDGKRIILQNTAIDGEESGEVLLTGFGSGAHQWQQSSDAGETSVNLDHTDLSKTTVKGLTPGQKIWFRNRQILRKGYYGTWSPWTSFVPRIH